jgi:hypothetical protein
VGAHTEQMAAKRIDEIKAGVGDLIVDGDDPYVLAMAYALLLAEVSRHGGIDDDEVARILAAARRRVAKYHGIRARPRSPRTRIP